MSATCCLNLAGTRRNWRVALVRTGVIVVGMLICHVALAVGSNELLNSSFETGATFPESWTTGSFTGAVQFDWSADVAFEGSRSVQVQNTSLNDAWWQQEVQLEPNSVYQLSGWIRTDGVAEAGAGASLSLYGTWEHTVGLHGTNDWTYVKLPFTSDDTGKVTVSARLGYWGGDSTGAVWFDDLQLIRIDPEDHPRWKIQVLIYNDIEVDLVDQAGATHHVRSTIDVDDVDTAWRSASDFVNIDLPALNSGNMVPTLLRLTLPPKLTTMSRLDDDGHYWLAPQDAANDVDPTADAAIVIWNPHGIDVDSGQEYLINGYAGLTAPMGSAPTYLTAIVDSVTSYGHRNVLKHEFGHSILFYYDAVGASPSPRVENHADADDYAHCGTGVSYVWQDESLAVPIPNSIYNNESGFTHDYYSGQTAVSSDVNRCLGITPIAWATGGPISKADYVASSPGDFNGDGRLNATDLDDLSAEVRAGTNRRKFDVNHDQLVNAADRDRWVNDLRKTYFGDADLDGEFNSNDLIVVFIVGQYEDDLANNSTWLTGDWDGDGDFTSDDLIVAFVAGGYETGPRPAAVPEPTSFGWLLGGMTLLLLRR